MSKNESECVLSCDVKTAEKIITEHFRSCAIAVMRVSGTPNNNVAEYHVEMNLPSSCHERDCCDHQLSLNILLFANTNNGTDLHVRKLCCEQSRLETIYSLERSWRLCVGEMYSQGLISANSGLRAISICNPIDMGWMSFLPYRQMHIIDSLMSRTSSGEPGLNEYIAADLAERKIFNRTTGENLHHDTVRRERSIAVQTLVKKGYFDTLAAIGWFDC